MITVSNLSNNSVATDNFNCVYRNMTNTSNPVVVSTGPVDLYGIIVNSHSSGVVKLWDNTVALTNVICNSITLAVGERFVNLAGISTNTALTVSIGGTADITLAYRNKQS